MSNTLRAILRTLVPIMLTLLVLGIFLALYFLQYLPDQRNACNHRAFLELEQMAQAAQGRTIGYAKAFRYNKQDIPVNTDSIPLVDTVNNPDVASDRSAQNDGNWSLLLSTKNKSSSIAGTANVPSIPLDSLMQPIVTTYQDVFEQYLLIKKPTPDDKSYQDNVMFSSGNVPIGHIISPDNLFAKSDTTNTFYVRDIRSIEGVPYKLFLYPFKLGKQDLWLAGLISTAKYDAIYKKFPLDLFAPAVFIVLLLLITLPILKIFILNAVERITDWDIRLIIGSYFIAAFAAALFFSWLFLLHIQSADIEHNLNFLSGKIQTSFTQEIKSINCQLKVWDSTFAAMSPQDKIPLTRLKYKSSPVDSSRVEARLHPRAYPYANYIFWIDSAGRWIARWSEKKRDTDLPLLSVTDRSYFQDYKNSNYLLFPSSGDTFTIEPTWSRLDGGYTVVVTTQSHAANDATLRPMLIGLSADLHSVSKTVLPVGYYFSIVDQKGKVLYDSKPGRPLQADIFREIDNTSSILQCIHFRAYRYFDKFQLRGQQVSLTTTPIKNLPYTLLIYYDGYDADEFQLHLIGLSAFFTTIVLLLLILSTLINTWTGKGPQLLQAPIRHFEWLRPLQSKNYYYCYLIIGMFAILCILLSFWFVIDWLFKEEEFSMFFILLAFPFHIAGYYYLLREKQKGQNLLPVWPVLLFLAGAVFVIQVLAFIDHNASGWSLLLAQVFFLACIIMLLMNFKPGDIKTYWNWLSTYSTAIVTGVFMISIIPACGIFWLFFRQENSLQHNSNQLEMSRNIDVRRSVINQRFKDFKFGPADSPLTSVFLKKRPVRSDSLPPIFQLKSRYGIYTLSGDTIGIGTVTSSAIHPVAPQYLAIHRFIPWNKDVLSSTTMDFAYDSSWTFYLSNAKPAHILLQNTLPADRIEPEPLYLISGQEDTLQGYQLMMRRMGMGGTALYLAILLLGLFISCLVTRAMAIRIFLLNMFEGYKATLTSPTQSAVEILSELEDKAKEFQEDWRPLPAEQKFILYDFALDGFTNYKAGTILYSLQKKGLLILTDKGELLLKSDSFREFVLQQSDDPQMNAYFLQNSNRGQWRAFKIPLLILFCAFGLFLFITQDDLYQKLAGVFTTIITIASAFSSNFDKIIPKLADPVKPPVQAN